MLLNRITTIMICGLSCLLLNIQAQSMVVFGFDINTAGSNPIFTASAGDVNTIADDTLSASTTVDLTATVNGTAVPDSNGYVGASFNLNASLTSITQAGDYIFMNYAGTFSFDTSDQVNIISGNFSDLALIFFAPGGTIAFPVGLSAQSADPVPFYTAGAGLTPYLPANQNLVGAQTFNTTVDDLSMDDPSSYFTDFDGVLVPSQDATFSGSMSAVSDISVPEPASLIVLLMGIGLIKRQRPI